MWRNDTVGAPESRPSLVRGRLMGGGGFGLHGAWLCAPLWGLYLQGKGVKEGRSKWLTVDSPQGVFSVLFFF